MPDSASIVPDFSLLDDGLLTECRASVGRDGVRLGAAELERSLGWQIKPEGLCRGDVCVPVTGHAGLVDESGVDLARFCDLIGRPFALDLDERVMSLGASASQRGDALRSGQAPAFELPDLSGRIHSLAEHRGKKVLLIAYASW